MKRGYLQINAASLKEGEYLTLAKNVDVKKNKTLTFTAKVEDFSSIRIGHGETSYCSCYVDIDQTEMRVTNFYREEVPAKAEPHGLDIRSYITVVIHVDVQAQITLFTALGCYTMKERER